MASVVHIPLVRAKAVITFTGVAVADETLKLGPHTYVFKAAPSAAFEIDVKADETTQAAAVASAINLDGTAGAYGASHVLANPCFSATSAAGVITVTSRVSGLLGSGFHIAFTATNGTNIAALAIVDSAGDTAGSGDFAAFIVAMKTGLIDPKAITINALDELVGG